MSRFRKRREPVVFGHSVELPRSGKVFFVESQEEARRMREALRTLHPKWFKPRTQSRATV